MKQDETDQTDIHIENARGAADKTGKTKWSSKRGKAMLYAFARVFGIPERSDRILKGGHPLNRE